MTTKTDNRSVSILGPVAELPAEGRDPAPAGAGEEFSALEFVTDTLADSGIGFDITTAGAESLAYRPGGEIFQRFDVGLDEVTNDPFLDPGEEAVEIDFEALFSEYGRFDDLSELSDPVDFVRRFLDVVGKALDSDPESRVDGWRHIPVIRWENRDDEAEAGARVQLLGILQATDEQFEAFCQSENDDFDLILQEIEAEGRGLREVATAVMILGIGLGSTQQAEAGNGWFKKLKEKRQARAQQVEARKAIRKAPAPVKGQQAGGWADVHNDARVDHHYLAATRDRAEAVRKVVVDVANQRAYLVIDGRIAIDAACSTARAGKSTPRGEFKITERIRTGKRSTIYGCEMPYWMRLDTSDIGMHIGDLPGYPASAGCVRLPHSVAPILFDNTSSGTTVQIVDNWQPDAGGMMLAESN